MRIEAVAVSQRAGGDRRTLSDVTLTIEPGQLVAIAGASGAGKTTLLDALAGIRPPAEGSVRYDEPLTFGYVPQDDIIHRELPLARTLAYAARLRLPKGTAAAEIDKSIRDVLDALDLSDRADVAVGSLSGGQRKRASIAVELLTRPRVFFLDEPTSGLDPATAANFMRLLRRLADEGTTVVLTTHNPSDVRHCDAIAFLARDGHLAFYGGLSEALRYFEAAEIGEIYEVLAGGDPQEWGERFANSRSGAPAAAEPLEPAEPADSADPRGVTEQARRAERIGPLRQWLLLTRRNLDILLRNRLTLAILAGSPLMVLVMFAVLFQPGAFDPARPSPSTTVMTLFWIAFGGFFFGLAYGLLQICVEFAILRRERLAGLSIGAYVLAKAAVLLPLLAVADALMLAVLRGLDRLPAGDAATYGRLFVTLVLSSAAALALGLLTSAAVSDPAQAAIALPMLCFPQVLFVGAILPVPVMATAGRVLSYAMSNRWAFEGLGGSIGIEDLWARGGSPLGPPLLASYGDTFSRPVALDWALLGGFTVVFLVTACLVLQQRNRGPRPVSSGIRS
ncbi:ATP-binding cassette domain-containing protein [Microbispora sp. NPDC049125]|uniref:ATP-binding cassette domain-containing protein n=1 Tax=Microbispora sp. NPDC049125 TaxID=3154929 RepID=UPI00346664A2